MLQHNICYPHNLFVVLWNLMISWIVFILHRKIFPIHHTYIYSIVSYLFIKQDQMILTCNSAVASLMLSRFFIVYILLYNTILNWFSLTHQSLNIDFFPGIALPVSILLLLYFQKNNTKNIADFSLLVQKKKTYSKIKVYCKQNRHFYRDFS